MEDNINTNAGTSGGTVFGWETGTTAGQGSDGLFGVAGQGNYSYDTTLGASSPYSDNTNAASGYYVYVTEAGTPVLYPASTDDTSLLDNPLNITYSTDEVAQTLEDFLSTVNADPDYSQYEGIPVSDPEINALAQKLGVPPAYVQANVTMTEQFVFNQQLANLPKDVAQKLQFAYYVQGAADNLSPELKAQYDAIMGNVNAAVAADFGFSAGWEASAPDSLNYTDGINAQYDQSVEAGLNEAVANGTLTAEEAATLRTLHYNPESTATVSPELRALLTGIESNATQALQAKYGFSTSWTPTPDVATYALVVNGDFAQNYLSQVSDYYGSDVSDSDKALLEAYFANPNDSSIPQRIKDLGAQVVLQRQQLIQYFTNRDDPSIPDNIKAKGQEFIAAATATTIAKFNLDANWTPPVMALNATAMDPQVRSMIQNMMQTLNEIFAAASAAVSTMSDPMRAVYTDYLKQVGLAIISLQEAINAMQVANTTASKRSSTTKMLASLDDLNQQQIAADTIKDKMDKMGDNSALKIFTDVLTYLVIAVVGLCMGPLAFAFAAYYCIDKAVNDLQGKSTTWTQTMFNKISDACGDGSWVVNSILCGALACASGNVFVAVNLFCTDSRIVQDFVKMCGGNEMAQEITNMVVTILIQIFLMVILFVCTGGIGGAAEAAAMVARITELTGSTVETATRIVNAVSWITDIIMLALTIAPEGVNLNNNILLAQVDMIRGNADARTKELEELVAILQELLDKLLGMLNSNQQWYQELGNFQGQKWSDASRVLTQLHNNVAA